MEIREVAMDIYELLVHVTAQKFFLLLVIDQSVIKSAAMQDAKQNKGDQTKQNCAYYKIDHIAPPYDISIHIIICR